MEKYLTCVGYYNMNGEESFLIFNQNTYKLKQMTKNDLLKHVDNVFNLELEDNNIVSNNGSIKRYEVNNKQLNAVIIKKFINKKNNVVGYLFWDGAKVLKWQEDQLINYILQARKTQNSKCLGFANAKIVETDEKKPYISSISGEFQIVVLDNNTEKLFSSMIKIIANNMKSGVVEFSRDKNENIADEINMMGIEPFVKMLRRKGYDYDIDQAEKVFKEAAKQLDKVYTWSMYEPDIYTGDMLFKRYSADKEIIEKDYKNYIKDEAMRLVEEEGRDKNTVIEELVAKTVKQEIK